METDIGNPIEYDPTVNRETEEEAPAPSPPEEFFYPYPHMPPPTPQNDTFDAFKNVSKSTWIIAFAVFLLGFFMGKTMQPVILRYA